METPGAPSLEELLGRADLFAFVERYANSLTTVDEFMGLEMPAGVTAERMLDLVEFVRRTGAGLLVCGQNRGCDHAGSWYAMTSSLSSRVAFLEYRTRPKGSLHKDFAHYRDVRGCYPAQLEELACVLSLDGAVVSYETLRGLCGEGARGVGEAGTGARRLAANALGLLAGMDARSELPVTCELLMEMYAELTAGVGDLPCTPAVRPATPIKSTCDHFGVGFIAESMQGVTPFSVPAPLFVLFCSDSMWKVPCFSAWNNTMELLVRSLLFSSIGMPLLRHVPLAQPFWRWQSGVLSVARDRMPYEKSMFWSRFGGDMTGLFSQMLGFLERGLDELASWVAEQRARDEACREAVRSSCLLNHRQRELLLDVVADPRLSVDAAGYERRFDVVPSTAYADLRKLVGMGVLVACEGGGKTARTYRGAPDFENALRRGCTG